MRRRHLDVLGHYRAHRPAAKGVGRELLALVVATAKRPKDLTRLDLPAVANDRSQRRGRGLAEPLARQQPAADHAAKFTKS